jgi:hypothetical protein
MSKVYTYLRYEMDGDQLVLVESESYDYAGPSARCDRAAVAQSKSALDQSTTAANNAASNEAQERSALMPGLESEAQNAQGYTPQQENQMLTASEQGAGGAASGVTGQANLEAARTGNSAGLTSGLDDAMRTKGQMLSENALGVKTASADLGQKKQQAAQQELGGIMSGDQSANLSALGLENTSINTELASSKQGWLQNAEGVANTAANVAKSAEGM